MISHLFEELEDNCDRVAVMNRGRVLAIGQIQTYKRLWQNKTLNKIFEDIVKKDK